MDGRAALSSPEVSRSARTTDRPPKPDVPQRGVEVALPAIAALAYGLGQLAWYLGTPLGRVPVLDERENLDLATAIAGGSLPWEPFYRAPGYALLLAGLRGLGVSAGGLFPAALLLGVGLHAAGAALAAALARRWFGNAAALAAGLLFALDPVLVHFATQALDSTLSLTLFLAGLNFLAAALDGHGRGGAWAGASLSWAAATLARPNYLLAWVLAPALALTRPGAGRARTVSAALAGVLLFATASAWQWSVGGSRASSHGRAPTTCGPPTGPGPTGGTTRSA